MDHDTRKVRLAFLIQILAIADDSSWYIVQVRAVFRQQQPQDMPAGLGRRHVATWEVERGDGRCYLRTNGAWVVATNSTFPLLADIFRLLDIDYADKRLEGRKHDREQDLFA